jgi:hypothetical protein
VYSGYGQLDSPARCCCQRPHPDGQVTRSKVSPFPQNCAKVGKKILFAQNPFREHFRTLSRYFCLRENYESLRNWEIVSFAVREILPNQAKVVGELSKMAVK